MARILFTTFGSFGDVFPYLAIGQELARRGFDVTVATSATYAERIRAAGLGFHAVRPDMSLDDRKMLEYVYHRRLGSERVIRLFSSAVQDTYHDTRSAVEQTDVLVTHLSSWAAIAAAEGLRKPWISTVLAPFSFLSAFDPPVIPQALWTVRLRVFGPAFLRAFFRLGQRQSLSWVKEVIALRRSLGLPVGKHPLVEGNHSPDLVLALFSGLLGPPQPDWPGQTRLTGFPFLVQNASLPPEVERFLDAGEPPVAFTLGSSAVGAAGDFYRTSLEALRRTGLRGLLLTGSQPQGLPERLPAGVLAAPYAPHSAVFPRAAALVHQGGVGTTGQAMSSGRPMLVVPFAFDQFDNAARVRRLGIAEVLRRGQYTPSRAAAALLRLTSQSSFRSAAKRVGDQMQSENGAVSAASAIADFANARR